MRVGLLLRDRLETFAKIQKTFIDDNNFIAKAHLKLPPPFFKRLIFKIVQYALIFIKAEVYS
ncbi:MAG TPA: hypothetical protein DEQ84_06100 [Prevotellaceae bacterium]|nr:hypothetical protein [Prevotellaceae bacterium]